MQKLTLVIERTDGQRTRAPAAVPHRYADRGQYYRSGGILPYVLGELLGASVGSTTD
jgi:aconitase A